jgi:SAM-dependent methyltransferase
MAGTVRHLPPVRAVDALDANHQDHPMRLVTNDMAAGASFDAAHADAVQALFDSMAEGWHAHDVPDRLVPLEDALERCDLPEGVLVELGAGTGIGTRVIARFRPVHAAVDLSAGMLAQAPAGVAPWTRADASRLPLADRSVDVLVLLNMLLFPAEVDRVLAPAGALVWVNTVGEATPIHLPAEAVVDALPGQWHADASRAGAGTWCVARRRSSLS